MEQPTIKVYENDKYIIQYNFEHMTYILNSKIDDSFLMTTRHYHKIIGWLISYEKLNPQQIDDVGFEITRNFAILVK